MFDFTLEVFLVCLLPIDPDLIEPIVDVHLDETLTKRTNEISNEKNNSQHTVIASSGFK